MKQNSHLALILVISSVVIFISGCEEQQGSQKLPSENADTQANIENSKAEQQEMTTKAPIPAEEAVLLKPKLVFINDVCDLGDIDPSSKHTCLFKFANKGSGILKIKKIISTCSCSVPELKKKEYKPGESGTIKVVYTANNRAGSVAKSLYVQSNNPEKPKYKFTVKANITKKIDYEPKKLILKLNKENAGVNEITVKSIDGKKFAISKIKTSPGIMKFDYDPVVESKEFILKPKVDIKNLKAGQKSGNIILTLTHPSLKNLRIPFNIIPPFKSDPTSLVALNAKPGKSVRKTIYILSNYGDDFDVESVKVENDIIKIVDQRKEPDKYVIDLDIIPPEKTPKRNLFDSKVIINIAGGEQLVIKCIGTISKK